MAKTKTIAPKELLPAVAKATGEGRGTTFREDPTKENADAIVDVVRANLYRLAGIKGSKEAKPTKSAKTEKTKKAGKLTSKIKPKAGKAKASSKTSSKKVAAKPTKKLKKKK